jgi:flagellar hook-associated protein 1 FlgK
MTLGRNDIVAKLAELFAGFGQIASAPTDESIRGLVIETSQRLTTTFQSLATDVERARDDADSRIVRLADQATNLAAEIAVANREIAISTDPVLYDQRELAAQKLAALVGGQGRVDPDGKLRFTIGGVVLVDGDRAAIVRTTADATLGGHLRIDVVDGAHPPDNVTGTVGGQLGGEVRFRDTQAAQAAADLDQLAIDLATAINAEHVGNFALDGSTGRNYFNTPTGAADLVVDGALIADPRLIGAADTAAGVPGDNQGILNLLAMRDDATLAGGGTRTFLDEGIEIASQVGRVSASADADREFAAARADTLAALRDSIAGVSVEEELAKLAEFQASSQAAARLVGTIDQLLARMLLML